VIGILIRREVRAQTHKGPYEDRGWRASASPEERPQPTLAWLLVKRTHWELPSCTIFISFWFFTNTIQHYFLLSTLQLFIFATVIGRQLLNLCHNANILSNGCSDFVFTQLCSKGFLIWRVLYCLSICWTQHIWLSFHHLMGGTWVQTSNVIWLPQELVNGIT
jgi:hypothetical protein